MVKFTSREIRDIIISMAVISFVFAYIFAGRNPSDVIFYMPITFLVVGLGFVLHELAHKFVAIRYGYWAEYRMWVGGLLLALIAAFAVGFVFAAPGAVYIHGNYIRNSENGKISLSGPATNIILAMLFLSIPLFFQNSLFVQIGILGASINSFLAFFNLIPFSMLDGAKIFRWNPLIWMATMGIAVLLLAYTLFGIRLI
ncbi:MAG: site-2 protease family protein [Methanobacterium sp.]